MDLDRCDELGKIDPADALADVEATPQQWIDGAKAAEGLRVNLDEVQSICVTGMGGSGIVGDIVATIAAERDDMCPVIVHKGYGVPAFVGPRCLVVAVSYSGNTEETLSAFDAAGAAGAQRLVVSSGGALASVCAAQGVPLIGAPPGRQPRHSLGYLAAPCLVALGLDAGLEEAVEVAADEVGRGGRGVPTDHNPAKQLGQRLAAVALAAAWGSVGSSAVAAYRLRCQLNENAKLPAISASLPELNHNEVVAWQEWSGSSATTGVVWLRDPDGEHPRIAARVAATDHLIADLAAWTVEVTARGRAPLARLLSLLVQVDLASIYAALALDRDPTPIPFISRLKEELARPAP